MAELILKPGREKSVLQRHPWIFSGAVDRIDKGVQPGETVEILSFDKKWLGRAAYSPESNIRARMWTWDAKEQVDDAFLRRRLEQALDLRYELIGSCSTNALRLVHGESDGLPGLVVDRYDDVLVMQCLSTGIDYWRDSLAAALVDLTGCQTIYERSDVDVRTLEGLPPRTGLLAGEIGSGQRIIHENGLKFNIDILSGQKTGFYIDQRANRKIVGELALERKVLNCFSYTGGFSLYALAGGASSVLSI
ncbi:MAG: class I SAM-dependent rRNA methyltransferase, partial [Anaerolineae bacterium]|nr:class I SAM-dependent rRNA methyltransferase [Anaerolineae bacterium]